MSDEGRIHAAIAVKLFFERENYQSLVDISAQQADASLTPCPELRANVIDDGDATLAHLASYAPVEGRRINDYGERGMAPVGLGDQLVKQAVDFGQMADDFGNADDGEVLGVDNRVASGGAHAVSAHAEKFRRRIAASQSLDELSAVHFTGGLARGDENSHASIVAGWTKLDTAELQRWFLCGCCGCVPYCEGRMPSRQPARCRRYALLTSGGCGADALVTGEQFQHGLGVGRLGEMVSLGHLAIE